MTHGCDRQIEGPGKGAAGEWAFDVLANEFELEELLEWGFREQELQVADFFDPNYQPREVEDKTENEEFKCYIACPDELSSEIIGVLDSYKRKGLSWQRRSIAAPQDLQSAINGNPATMTQYRGTQFGIGGAWVEPTYHLSVTSPGLPFVDSFDAKSDAQGVAAPNIGVTQDVSAWGLPLTMGLGLMSGSGAGVDFRHVPASNGTNASFVALDIIAGAGVSLTEQLSLGASIILSNATLAGPFVGN